MRKNSSSSWNEERIGNNNLAKQLVAGLNEDGGLEIFYIRPFQTVLIVKKPRQSRHPLGDAGYSTKIMH